MLKDDTTHRISLQLLAICENDFRAYYVKNDQGWKKISESNTMTGRAKRVR